MIFYHSFRRQNFLNEKRQSGSFEPSTSDETRNKSLSQAAISQADISQADISLADISLADISLTNISQAVISQGDISQADISHRNGSSINPRQMLLFEQIPRLHKFPKS